MASVFDPPASPRPAASYPATNAQRHRDTADALKTAIAYVNRALDAHDGLEWSARLEAALEELAEIRGGCERYAEFA